MFWTKECDRLWTVSECPELGPGLDMVTPDHEVSFPVPVGKEITVKCKDSDNFLSGSAVLTCDENGKLTYDIKPKCSDIGN